MALGNQYGINLDNVLSTGSVLKTAKLRREKIEDEMKDKEFQDVAYGNFVSKDNPNAVVAAIDENEDGEIDASEKRNALRNTGRKFNALKNVENVKEKRVDRAQIRSNRRASRNRADTRLNWQREDRAKKEQQKKVREDALTKMYVSRGNSLDEARRKVAMGQDEYAKYEKTYAAANKEQRKVMSEETNALGNNVMGLIQLGGKNPEMADKKFRDFRETQLRRVSELRKAGLNDEADKVQDDVDSMPVSLIDTKGNFNNDFLTDTLMLLESNMKSMEETDQKQRTLGQEDTRSAKAYKIIENMVTSNDVVEGKKLDKKQFMAVAELTDEIMSKNKGIRPASAVKKAMKQLGMGKSAKKVKLDKPPKGQVSNDGTQIYDGSKWVPYKKR